MLDRLLKHIRLRGHCRLGLSSEAVSVRSMGASRKSASVVAEQPVPDPGVAAPDELARPIAAALSEAQGSGLPVYATLADDLVRYFIVTPPGNSARMQDLRAAVAVRFQMLYGEAASAWHLVADWQADVPFLACAVPQRICTALQLAVASERSCLVSIAPNFVAAWNRSRRELGAGGWLATLGDGALTLGLIADGAKPRLAAVRTLALPQKAPPMTWLREQVARAALLDDLPVPSVLHVHGQRLDVWRESATPSGDAGGMSVRWCAPGDAPRGLHGGSASSAAQLAWSGVAP
jgi:hypothetical protein